MLRLLQRQQPPCNALGIAAEPQQQVKQKGRKCAGGLAPQHPP